MGSLPGNYHMGGQKAGPFLLERLQYHGAHGPLYYASEGGKFFAVKMLGSYLGKEDPQELAKWKAIEHRRIARVVAVGNTEYHPFVASEWLEGSFLDEEMAFNPLAPQRMLMLTRAIAEGLKLLHSIDLVHGNLKVSNVFVGSPDSNASIWVDAVKLIDPSLVGWTDVEKRSQADDLAACKQILRAMMMDGEGAPPPAMNALFDATSAAALEAACTACYQQLSDAERTAVRVRKPLPPQPVGPQVPMPSNWSPPPSHPQFQYTPMAARMPITNPSPPPPDAPDDNPRLPDVPGDAPRKRWWMFWR